MISISLIGCGKEFLEENPPHIIGVENLLVDEAGFEAGLAALYNSVRLERSGISGSLDGGANDLILEAAHSGTDIIFGLQIADRGRIWNDFGPRNNPSEAYFSYVWTWLYQIVNASNHIILSAENEDVQLEEITKLRIVAEAKTIRAWAYRNLTNLFGDVPLNLQASSGANIKTDWERTPISEIWVQMEKDLLYAKDHLPETSVNEGKIVKWVAQHYLAELYLYKKEYGKAKDEALNLIEEGPYSLVTERYGVEENQPGTAFSDMFIEGNSRRSQGNTEVLWLFENEFQVIGGEGHNIMRRWWASRYYSIERGGTTPIEISEERGGRPLGRLGMTKFMFNLYEKGDDRRSNRAIRQYFILKDYDEIPAGFEVGDTVHLNFENQVEKDLIAPEEWPYTRKWDSTTPENLSNARQYNDQIYLRLGETYLILAEAYFYLEDNKGAADAINELRERSNASLIGPDDITIDFILDERARELFSEEIRRYALLRNNKWLERTRAHNPVAGPKITERDLLFPIPQDVIDANLTIDMPQNPDYTP